LRSQQLCECDDMSLLSRFASGEVQLAWTEPIAGGSEPF
jgi:hypothetical protein